MLNFGIFCINVIANILVMLQLKFLYFPRFWEIVIINVVFILIGNFIYLILIIFLRNVTLGPYT